MLSSVRRWWVKFSDSLRVHSDASGFTQCTVDNCKWLRVTNASTGSSTCDVLTKWNPKINSTPTMIRQRRSLLTSLCVITHLVYLVWGSVETHMQWSLLLWPPCHLQTAVWWYLFVIHLGYQCWTYSCIALIHLPSSRGWVWHFCIHSPPTATKNSATSCTAYNQSINVSRNK